MRSTRRWALNAQRRPLHAVASTTDTPIRELSMSVPAPLITPFGSVSRLLIWMAKRAAPLTGIAISIAALLWSDFRREFALPIGFASSSMLTALPSLAAIVCVAVGCIVTGIAVPAMVLTHPLRKDAASLAQLCLPTGSVSPEPEVRRTTLIIRRYWVGMGVASVVAWAMAIGWMSIRPDTPLVSGFLLLLGCILLQTASARPTLQRALRSQDPASAGFYWMLLFSLLLQYWVAFWAMYAVVKSIAASTFMAILACWVVLVLVMAVVAMFQMMVSQRVTHGWYPNLLKHLVCLALVLLGFVGMIPPLGARLAAFALLSTASAERPCTILLFKSDIHDTVPKAIVDMHHPSQSKELRVVFPSDGKLYIKESVDGPTYFIDLKALVGTASCPRLGSS